MILLITRYLFGVSVGREDLIETAGASQGLSFLSNTMFESGDLVFVEEKTYFMALKVLEKDQGMKVVPGMWGCGGVCVWGDVCGVWWYV